MIKSAPLLEVPVKLVPFAVVAALIPMAAGLARADSRLTVAHQMQSAWHGYVVYLDGQRRSDASANAKTIGGVAPGRHELSVNIVSSPIHPEGKPLCVGPVDVPDFTEVRIKCEDNGGITIIGMTSYGPPPPPPDTRPLVVVQTTPATASMDARGDADELLAMASRQMADAPPACARLRTSIYDLRFDLAARRRGQGGRHRLGFETAALADQARDVCPQSAVALLRDASRALAPFESAPPPRRPEPANPQQLDGMRAAINGQPPGPPRLDMLRQVTRGSWFFSRQVAMLIRLIPYPPERMAALRDLAPRVIDPENAFEAVNTFVAPNERNEAQAMFGQ
jgi:hypothetical protein